MEQYRVHPLGTFRSVLLTSDATEYSEGAIRESIRIAKAWGTRFTIVHVIDFNVEYEPQAYRLPDIKHMDRLERNAREHLHKVVERAQAEKVLCDVLVVNNPKVHEAILDEAEDNNSNIIVMGRRHSTGLKRFLFGSVTAKVISASLCRVLVVPQGAEIKGESIMLIVDASSGGVLAENEAFNIYLRCVQIKIFVVVAINGSGSSKRIADAERTLQRIKKNGELRGIRVSTLIHIGKSCGDIVEISRRFNTDLIIVDRHHYTLGGKLIMFNIFKNIVAFSPCSVLVVEHGRLN